MVSSQTPPLPDVNQWHDTDYNYSVGLQLSGAPHCGGCTTTPNGQIAPTSPSAPSHSGQGILTYRFMQREFELKFSVFLKIYDGKYTENSQKK